MARTGVPRTSIHFYLRQGLLPQPQKTAANRSLYTDDHVRLLKSIKNLQKAGLSLAEIKAEISDELARINERDADLVDRENERMRKTILRVATQEFMQHGYDQARVADIIRKAGVSTQVFYHFFPSKAELLVESFKTFVSWNVAYVEGDGDRQRPDPGEWIIRAMLADARANELGSAVLALIRKEVPNGMEYSRLVEQAWAPIMNQIIKRLEEALKPGVAPPVPLELLAYSMLGAHHNTCLRASWDDQYSREQVFATHLWLWLKVLDALGEQEDPDPHLVRYGELIRAMAIRKPESPPAVDE